MVNAHFEWRIRWQDTNARVEIYALIIEYLLMNKFEISDEENASATIEMTNCIISVCNRDKGSSWFYTLFISNDHLLRYS